MAEDQIPVEALRFLIKVDRMTMGAVQFAQYTHDLANDVTMMADDLEDPAREDLGDALKGLDDAIAAIEVGFEGEFDSYQSMERSRDAAAAGAQALEAALDVLEAMGEYDPEA